jgi:flagellar protein FliS
MVNPYGDQLEVSVLAASPVELTRMLFEKLLSEIRSARRFLREGDVGQRSRSASRAVEVAGELARSLDEERGGELSRNLRRIYVYVVEQVNEGNTRQEEQWFANAEAAVAPLAEAWREIADQGIGSGTNVGSPPCWGNDVAATGSLSFSG